MTKKDLMGYINRIAREELGGKPKRKRKDYVTHRDVSASYVAFRKRQCKSTNKKCEVKQQRNKLYTVKYWR